MVEAHDATGIRIDATGAVHHVMIRGIERGRHSEAIPDKNHLLERLRKSLTEIRPEGVWAFSHDHVLTTTQCVSYL